MWQYQKLIMVQPGDMIRYWAYPGIGNPLIGKVLAVGVSVSDDIVVLVQEWKAGANSITPRPGHTWKNKILQSHIICIFKVVYRYRRLPEMTSTTGGNYYLPTTTATGTNAGSVLHLL